LYGNDNPLQNIRYIGNGRCKINVHKLPPENKKNALNIKDVKSRYHLFSGKLFSDTRIVNADNGITSDFFDNSAPKHVHSDPCNAFHQPHLSLASVIELLLFITAMRLIIHRKSSNASIFIHNL